MELSTLASGTPPQMVVDEATESMQAAVLARDIPFSSYFTAGLLSDRDVQLLRRYDKRDKFTQSSLWEKARPGVPGRLGCASAALEAALEHASGVGFTFAPVGCAFTPPAPVRPAGGTPTLTGSAGTRCAVLSRRVWFPVSCGKPQPLEMPRAVLTRRAAVQEGTAYAAVFVNVLRSVAKDETTQYVLALLDEALAGARNAPRCRATPLPCALPRHALARC